MDDTIDLTNGETAQAQAPDYSRDIPKLVQTESGLQSTMRLADIDRWFEQRPTMIEELKKARTWFLQRAEETEQRLALLGVTFPQEHSAAAEQFGVDDLRKVPTERLLQVDEDEDEDELDEPVIRLPRRKVGKALGRKISIMDAVTYEPQKLAAIAERADVTSKEAFQSLTQAQKHGLVKRTGKGGAFWSKIK